MDLYSVIKALHILSATVLFGVGLGTAFFMFRSRYAADLKSKYDTARSTVRADYLFIAPAAIVQPLTGAALIVMTNRDGFELWLVVTYGLYLLTGFCWLPVVWIQIRLRAMLLVSLETGDALPERYDRLTRLWFVLGWPAFSALIVVFYLMVAKPTW